MEIIEQKKELIEWISSLENKNILDNIYQLKKETTSNFNFDEELKKGLSVEKFREEMKMRVKKYSLK
jgi:hypothetical protein